MKILFAFLLLMLLILGGYLIIWFIGRVLEEIILKFIGENGPVEEDEKDGLV